MLMDFVRKMLLAVKLLRALPPQHWYFCQLLTSLTKKSKVLLKASHKQYYAQVATKLFFHILSNTKN